MENLFLKYMNERSGQKKANEREITSSGPVFTISREYGCPALRIADKLSATLTAKGERMGVPKNWRCVSKEIIEQSARELKLTASATQDLKDYKHNSFFENMALFFSDKYYPGDVKIKNTIAKFIYEEASEGYSIIVGRGGEVITKNIPQSFHIKLYAPLGWRSEIISTSENISVEDAKKKCIENDKRRSHFRDYFEKGVDESEFYDMSFNCQNMTDEEIVEMLVIIAETRGFVL